MDRAHRIGQGRPVNVYRLVTQGTVEEQVLALQRRKREMAEAVVQQGNAGRFEDRGMAG
jgi:SNF2 family DNA or RNA helicase